MSLYQFDQKYCNQGSLVAGFDEAGRGAWAGPVSAACVIMPQSPLITGINDSKKLTPKKREKLFEEITATCVSYGVALVDSTEIDRINILEATKQAMVLALSQLKVMPAILLIDGDMTIDSKIPQEAIIDGDAKSYCIAAASIIAKVTRDRLMVDLSRTFPQYGFEQHKGYGTKVHQDALKQFGCLPIHRKSYAPIRSML
ncbi:MAG TPA: ribonuclease HII [bacterium]|nr:ribonuclease HII [bacterium]